MNGIVFAILCAVFVGFSQLSLRKSYKEFPPSVAFFFDAIFGLLIWVPLAIGMGISGNVSWPHAILFAFISAILSEAIVFYALSRGELAVTATVIATYPVYTVIFSRILNAEMLTVPLTMFVIMAIVGSVVASLPDNLKSNKLKHIGGIVWPFIAAICIGISDTISKGYINRSNDFSFLFSLGFIQVPIALAYLRIEKQSLSRAVLGVVHKVSDYKYALLGGLFNIIGTGFLWLSFSFIPASIASPITGSNGVFTVLLARVLLRERISKQKYIAIAVAFIGIIGIAVTRNG